ncbi:MAG: hypothetical protein AB7O49_20335 [Sphingomonadales bacterium]
MTTLLFGLFYIGLFVMAIAAVVAGVFYVVARAFTRNVAEGRRGFLRAAVLLPFLSAAWIGAVTLVHLSASLPGEDRDALRLDLPNGYVFSAGKGEDKGNIAHPDGGPAIIDLRRLQVAGEKVFATRFLADQMERMRQWYPNGLAGTHMILDTRSGAEVWLEEKAFEAEVKALGAALALRPVAELRQDARPPDVADGLAGIVAFGAPLIALLLLIRRGVRLRRTSAPPPPASAARPL